MQLYLGQLVNDFGLSRNVAIYALLAKGVTSLEPAVLHVVELREEADGGQMRHPYIGYDPSFTGDVADLENGQMIVDTDQTICYICHKEKSFHMSEERKD